MPRKKTKNQESFVNPTSDTQIHTSEVNTQYSSQETIENTQNRKRKRNKPYVTNIPYIPPIDIIDKDDADDIAKKANKISLASVIVNLLLFVCTLALAYISYKQANSANNAAKIADKTLNADTLYNNKTYKQSRIDADSNNRREDRRDIQSKKNIDIQNHALVQQIKALMESHDQFTKENTPYLQVISDTQKMQLRNNGVIRIFYKNAALCKIPIQTKRAYIGVFSSFSNVDSIVVAKMIKDKFTNIKPSNEYFYGIDGNSHFIDFSDPTNEIRRAFLDGKRFMYLAGRYEYINYLNDKKRFYEFVILFRYRDGQSGYQYLFNSNYDAK